MLEKTGLPASRLELEITETALLEDCAANRDMLEQFRALGVRISLDDFGTGYSSLSQLRTFPFSKIKIDGSFVRDLGRDASSIAVIRAVTSIGGIIGMAVVAECVESEDQLQFLASAGCTEIQGYLLGADYPRSCRRWNGTLPRRSGGCIAASPLAEEKIGAGCLWSVPCMGGHPSLSGRDARA